MIAINFMDIKKVKWGVFLWCASLALLQMPLHGADDDEFKAFVRMPLLTTAGNDFDEETLSLDEQKMRRSLTDIKGDEIKEPDLAVALKIHGQAIIDKAERHDILTEEFEEVVKLLQATTYPDTKALLLGLEKIIEEEKKNPPTGEKIKQVEALGILEKLRQDCTGVTKKEEFTNLITPFLAENQENAFRDLFTLLKNEVEKEVDFYPKLADNLGKYLRNKDRWERKEKIAVGINVLYGLAVNNPSSLFKKLQGEIKDLEEDRAFEGVSYYPQAQLAINAVKKAALAGNRVTAVTNKIAQLFKLLDKIAEGTMKSLDVTSELGDVQNKIDALNAAVESAQKSTKTVSSKPKGSSYTKKKSSSSAPSKHDSKKPVDKGDKGGTTENKMFG